MKVEIVLPGSLWDYINKASKEELVIFSDRLSIGLAENSKPLTNNKIMIFAEVHVEELDRVGEYYFRPTTKTEIRELLNSIKTLPAVVEI